MTPSELIQQLRDTLDNYERDIEASQQKLSDLGGDIKLKQDELETIAKQVTVAKQTSEEKIKAFQENTAYYLKENARIKDDQGVLISQNSELKIDNVRLDKSNKGFKVYEEKAWKALKAKDESLVERERILQQKENLKPAAQSFLPPTN